MTFGKMAKFKKLASTSNHLNFFRINSFSTTSTPLLQLFKGKYISLEKNVANNNGVSVLRLDDSNNAKVNTLHNNLQKELVDVLNIIENDSKIKSVVVISSKKDCFIAGADIGELRACATSQDLTKLSSNGQKFMNRIAESKKPFVAAIHGSCMGGGLEVALACHYRIATENKKTQLSLPEVQLGLLPGAGGTQRLPKLVGLQESLGMMTTGKPIKPHKAKKMGLVDQLADIYALESAAIDAAEQLSNGSLKRKKLNKSLINKIIEDTPLRSIIYDQAKKKIVKATGGHYPAPMRILECVKEGIENGFTKGSEKESKFFGELGMTSESKSLVSIFYGQTELKKNRYGKPDKPVNTMAVLGAGLMGAGIAQVSASKGVRVLLKDRNFNAVSRGENHIRSDLDIRVSKRRMTGYEKDEIMSRIIPLSDDDEIWKVHFKNAELVIEAVFEDMELKHKVIKDLEHHVPENCIIATNTSALSVAEIASVSKRPENVIGMHYFSPVPLMPLLEIIQHDKTSDKVAAAAVDLGIRQGKTCIVVKDVPGFYINRCLGPYIAETLALVQDGINPEHLDKIVKKWGLPVGPITLADEVGVDVAFHVNETLSSALGIRMAGGNSMIFKDMIAKNFLGKKTGKGFFIQPESKKKKKIFNPEAAELIKRYLKTDLKLKDDDVINRLMSRFVNEAILCVQDEIISSPTDGDIGAVFGIGFPPFFGGPFRYIDSVGSTKYNEMMLRFADKYGEQFMPCAMLVDMAKTNKKFYQSN